MDLNTLFDYVKQGEGSRVEFKVEFPKNASDMAKEVAAFANTGGGVILIGISDGGKIVGVSNPDEVMQRLGGVMRTCRLTSGGAEIDKLSIGDDKYIVWVRVNHQDIPCIVEGRLYKRVGATTQQLEDGREWQRVLGRDYQSSQPMLVASPPRVKFFKGRADELSHLKSCITDETVVVVIIEGISGVGKTALAAQLAAQVTDFGYQCLWLECHEDTTIDSVLWILLGFAQSCGDRNLADILSEFDSSLEERLLRTAVVLAQHKYVLFFDDYHLIRNPHINRFIQKIEQQSGLAKVVLTSRLRPDLVSLVSPMATREVTIQEGLDTESCSQLLAECNLHVDPSLAQKIWELTGKGHPKALMIFAVRARNLSVNHLLQSLPVFRDELKQEWLSPLLNELPTGLRNLVIDLSVFDRPLSFDLLEYLSPGQDSAQMVFSLVDRFILDRVDDISLLMHALIREHCYPFVTDLETKHRKAAEYYWAKVGAVTDPELMSEEQIDCCLTAWSHFIKAGDHQKAVEVIGRLRKTLINQGQYEQLMFLIENTNPPTDEDQCWFILNQARIMSLWGDKEYATSLLEPMIDSEVLHISREAVLVLSLVYCEHDEPQKAIELLEKYAEMFWGRIRPLLKRRFLSRLVWAYRMIGELDKSLEWAAQIASSADVEGDEIGGATALQEMAAVFKQKGAFQPALALYEQSYTLFAKNGWLRESTISQFMLGETYEDMRNYKQALCIYRQALRQFIKIGEIKYRNLCRQRIIKIETLI